MRKRQQEEFEKHYGGKAVYRFPDPEQIDVRRFFCFPKFLGEMNLSLAALGIYPVLCLEADFEEDRWFHVPQESIARMAGTSVRTVIKATKELEGTSVGAIPLLKRKKESGGRRHFYLYKVAFVRKGSMEENRGRYFPFYRCLVESGVWAGLKPRAKALYLAMRQQAKFDADLYIEVEDLDISRTGIAYQSEEYRERKWDVCNDSLVSLCRLIGIDHSDIYKAVAQLENNHLVEKVGQWYKVYLRSRIG